MMSLNVVIGESILAGARDSETTLPAMSDEEFRAFYERTSRALWAYLSRIAATPDMADDLVQEAYYRFYRAGKEHQSESHRRNSLFRIATNLVRDSERRRKYRSEVGVCEEPEEGSVVPKSDLPPAETEAMRRTDLQKAMGKLDPTQREMLWLAYANGSSHEEIAEILGVRAVSIRTMLLRARRKLAAILTSEEEMKR